MYELPANVVDGDASENEQWVTLTYLEQTYIYNIV